MTGMGVVRPGNGPVQRSSEPLGWHTLQFGELVEGQMVWGEPERYSLHYGTAEEAESKLRERRKDKRFKTAEIPDGIEFNTYMPECEPCPELKGARTRSTWESAKALTP